MTPTLAILLMLACIVVATVFVFHRALDRLERAFRRGFERMDDDDAV
jgi:hypothetical protein